MAKYIIPRGIAQSDRQAALDLVKDEGGKVVELGALGTIVECSPDIGEALNLVVVDS